MSRLLSSIRRSMADKILSEVTAKHRVSVKELRAPGKSRYIVRPRREAVLRLRNELDLTYIQIGGLIGRDCSTVYDILARRKA